MSSVFSPKGDSLGSYMRSFGVWVYECVVGSLHKFAGQRDTDAFAAGAGGVMLVEGLPLMAPTHSGRNRHVPSINSLKTDHWSIFI